MIIFNGTPDLIEAMHIGITVTIKPSEVVEMDDSRGRHILNKFARRGLVQMQYGDDEAAKKKESIALWKNFWELQIVTFNQHNEDQKEKGNRYARPTPELLEKAKILNLELLQPWRIEKTDDKQIKALQAENVALKETVTEQTKQINQILEMLKAGKLTEAVPDPEASLENEVTTNKKKYASLNVKTMSGWLKNNWDEVQAMPEENRFEIQAKYEELYQTPFPAENPA